MDIKNTKGALVVINKTQLSVERALERGLIHRDYIAHCLRWSHIMKYVNPDESCILDIGCGDFPLMKTLYTNRKHPKLYHGIDIRDMRDKNTIVPNFEWLFSQLNATKDNLPQCKYGEWNIITCFEILEHNEKEDGVKLLSNIKSIMSGNTYLFLSTPCFNGDKANNHVYEWTHDELKVYLESILVIEEHYGTFASKRDIVSQLTSSQLEIYNQLGKYYDSNLTSILLAPLYPQYSRNCLWRCRLNHEQV